MYVGPVLFRSVIRARLYQRFMLLSYAVRLLLISSQFAKTAGILLQRFLDCLKEDHSEVVFSPNVHALSHLAWQVKSFGPLWTTSGLMFESANYLLQSKFTGTVNHLPLLVERYGRNKAAYSFEIANDCLSEFCFELKKRSKRFKLNVLTAGIAKDLLDKGDLFYSNCQIKNWEFDSLAHGSSKNSYISYISNNYTKYGQIRLFLSSNGFKKIAVDVINVIEGFKSGEVSGVPIFSFLRVTMSSKREIISEKSLKEKLMRINLDGDFFLVPLIDSFEHD